MSAVTAYTLLVDEVDSPAARRRCEALLSPDERARCARFVFDRHRREFLFAHALVRRALSRHAPSVPAEAWDFTATERGRPEVSGPAGAPRPKFNLSHTDDLVACVVADADEVGIDVETIDRAGITMEIAHRYFAPPEVEALMALPPEQRPRRFFEYWTLKEAYIKARGDGLALPLDRFHFALDGDRIRIAIAPELGDDPERWRFLMRPIGVRHQLALAVRPPPASSAWVIERPEVTRQLIAA